MSAKKLKDYEIFTTKYSKIYTAKNMSIALLDFLMEGDSSIGNPDYNDIVAVVEVERGRKLIDKHSACSLAGVIERSETSDKLECDEDPIIEAIKGFEWNCQESSGEQVF